MDVDDEFIMEPKMVLVRAVYRDIPQYITGQINNGSRPSSLQINYLESTYMRDYSNVQLLSCQGTKFELNSAQLAAASKFLHKLLHENEKNGEECHTVMTDIDDVHLRFIYDFITTGTIWTEELNADIEASFKSLGIDLRELSFSSIYGKKPAQDIKNVIPHEKSTQEAAEIDPLDDSKNEERKMSTSKLFPTNLSKKLVTKDNKLAAKQIVQLALDKGGAKKPRSKKRKATLKPMVDEEDVLDHTEMYPEVEVNEEEFECFQCNFKASNSDELKMHYLKHAISCEICGEDFDSVTKLHKHKHETGHRRKGKKEARWGYTMKTLADRRKERQSMPETIVCTECGKSIRNNKQCIEGHKAQHLEPSKEFACLDCNKMFASKIQLDRHIQAVHKGKTTCDQCGAVVATRRFDMHIHNYHTPEEKKKFRCECTEDCPPDCNFHCKPVKGFWTKLGLEDHLNMHRGIKAYTCKLGCSNLFFSNNGNLSAHIRSFHKGIKRQKK